jgi:hypothetical protein
MNIDLDELDRLYRGSIDRKGKWTGEGDYHEFMGAMRLQIATHWPEVSKALREYQARQEPAPLPTGDEGA